MFMSVQVAILSRSAIVVSSNVFGGFFVLLCFPFYGFSVVIGVYLIGMGHLSSFFLRSIAICYRTIQTLDTVLLIIFKFEKCDSTIRNLLQSLIGHFVGLLHYPFWLQLVLIHFEHHF